MENVPDDGISLTALYLAQLPESERAALLSGCASKVIWLGTLGAFLLSE